MKVLEHDCLGRIHTMFTPITKIFNSYDFSHEGINDEPTLEEIANEWDKNVFDRARELEAGIDDTYFQTIIPYTINKLRELVSPQSKILDVGCGLGYLTNTISQSGYDIIGIDISGQTINYARVTFPNIRFRHSSIVEFSKENRNRFDFCIVNMVLHNLVDINCNLLALNELLKSGGYVIASIPNPEGWFNRHPNIDKSYNFEDGTPGVYKIPFKIRRGTPHKSNITYIHRPIPIYNHLVKDAGFKLMSSESPKLQDGCIDSDLLFCVWQKE